MQRNHSHKTRVHHIRDAPDGQKAARAPPKRAQQQRHRDEAPNRREAPDDEIHHVKARRGRDVPLFSDPEVARKPPKDGEGKGQEPLEAVEDERLFDEKGTAVGRAVENRAAAVGRGRRIVSAVRLWR